MRDPNMRDQDRWDEDRHAPRGDRREDDGRPYGAGDYEYERGAGPRRMGEERAWRPYDPGHDGPDWRDQSGVRWQGAAGRGGERAGERDWRGSGEGRGFWDRTRDELAAWFGDRGAERRRQFDGEHRGRGPRGYVRPDERINEDVHDRLTEDSWLDATQIEVHVRGGEVTLNGRVRTREDRRRAEDIADRVSGVMHVQNNLRAEDQRRQGGSNIPPGYPS